MPDIKTAIKREKKQARLSPSEREQARAELKAIADKADVIINGYAFTSDSKLTEGGSAKFFVKSNGDSVLQNRGILNDREISKISEFIKENR